MARINPGFSPRRAFFRGPGGGSPKLFVGDPIEKEFTARINRPPVMADFQNPFLFQIATDVYNAGKRAIAALGAVLQMKAYMSETQEATCYDKFNCLMDNTMGRNPAHLEPLNTEGLITTHSFQLALHDGEYTYAHLPSYLQDLIPKKLPLSINFSAFNIQYYLFAMDKAHSLEKEKNMDEALLWFKIAILLNPDLYFSYLAAGFIYTQLRDFNKALGMYDRLVSLMPDEAITYYQRGVCYAELGELAKAEADFRKALELQPDLMEAKFNLIGMCIKQGKCDDALTEMFQLAEEFPAGKKAPVFVNISHLYCQKNDFYRAIIFAQKAVEDNPYLANGYFNWAIALANLGRYKEALEQCELCLKIKPDLESVHLLRAYLLYYLGRTSEAMQWCRDTIFKGRDISDEALLAYLQASRTEGEIC